MSHKLVAHSAYEYTHVWRWKPMLLDTSCCTNLRVDRYLYKVVALACWLAHVVTLYKYSIHTPVSHKIW